MTAKTFNGDQKIKLTQIINEGMQVMHEIDTLQGGLTDTIKAVAEELEVKPAILKKASICINLSPAPSAHSPVPPPTILLPLHTCPDLPHAPGHPPGASQALQCPLIHPPHPP
jgi:hypothetical protein